MKRKSAVNCLTVKATSRRTVKCAAANDDDFQDTTPSEPSKRSQRRGISDSDKEDEVKQATQQARTQSTKQSTKNSTKKSSKAQKYFAWMDSGDECEDEDSDAAEKTGAPPTEDVSAPSLDAVTSFGQFVRLAESLQAHLEASDLEVVDIAAAYRAMARVKFFDGDLLDSLNATLCKLVRTGKLTDGLACDAIECLSVLNAYDRNVFSVIAQVYKSKILTLDIGIRNMWFKSYKHFEHSADKDFLQMLEVSPMPATHFAYKKIRCRHHAQGSCALGESMCTFSHDPRAPPSLEPADVQRRHSTVMLTQCQLLQGRGAYTAVSSAAP
mmetsp:Transcript_74655/g.132373  ORF Transcript_74655/g.132373 Transcript_74655/m.132373 type:complete len:326 (-) Transcript_74655:44-1021(-)